MLDNVIEFLINGDSSDANRAFGELNGAISGAVKILGALGVAFSAVKFADFIQKQIDITDEFSKMSQRTGVAVTTLSQLDHAFNLAGLSSADMETSFKFLNKSMDEAKQGNDAAIISFESIGVTMEDLKTKSPDKVLLQIADAYTKIEDPVARNTMLLEKFSRAGTKLAPAFAEGAAGIEKLMKQADDLGLTIDEEFGQSAERFNDNMSNIGEMAAGAGRSIAKMLLPILNDTIEALFNFGDTAEESILPWGKIFVVTVGSIANILLGFKSVVSNVITFVVGGFTMLGGILGAVGASIGQILEGDFKGATETLAAGWEDAGRVGEDALGKIENELNTTGTAILNINRYMDEYDQNIKKAGETTKEASKFSLNPISKQAAADLEAYRLKQIAFIDGLIKSEASASQNKIALLNAEAAHQRNIMKELRLEGANLVKAQEALDKWYATSKVSIQEEMLSKLGASDEAYRNILKGKAQEDANRMVQAGLTQIEADQFLKATLLQQQIDFDALRLEQQDLIYATENEKALVNDEINQARLQLAESRGLITKQQHADALVQMELTKQSKLGNIHATAELNRLLVSKMTFGQQLAFTSQALDSISGLMQSQSKEGFRIGKAAAIAQAVINTYTAATGAYASASAIYGIGWILGPIAAAAAIVLGMQNVNKIRSQQMVGQAHSGMTSVPNEGTFLLSKGERVLQPEQNRDLTNFLDNRDATGAESGGVHIGTLSIEITVPNGEGLRNMTRREWEDIVSDKVIPALNVLDRKGVRPDANQRLGR